MGDWEEDASVAILGYIFSPGSGAATSTADTEHAPSQGRNDGRPICVHSRADRGVVGEPLALARASITKGSASGGDRTCNVQFSRVSLQVQLCQAAEPSHHMRELLSGRGTRLLRPGCRRRTARNWRDNLYLPRMLGAWTTSAAESTGGEGAQKGGRVGVASRTCAKARARAVTRSSSCTIANVCTLHHRRPASAPQ